MTRIVRPFLIVFCFAALFPLFGRASNRTHPVVSDGIIRPGFGHPGRISAYDPEPELLPKLAEFSLSAGWFEWDGPFPKWWTRDPRWCAAPRLPFLLFRSPDSRKSLPLVLYLGGTGEHGTRLSDQFHQQTVFRKVTSPEFQQRHPCHLFAPMLPKGAIIRCAQQGWSSEASDLLCDAMYAAIAELGPGAVDTNRIYVTGLSYGGGTAFELCCQYPGRFAAAIPVSAIQFPYKIPEESPGNYYLLYNDGEFTPEEFGPFFADLAERVRSLGGDFRMSSFAANGHNAWDAAWSEDFVWDWAFTKTADGRPVPEERSDRFRPKPQERISAVSDRRLACSTSRPETDAEMSLNRAVDGLSGTFYVSPVPMADGDWFQVAFDRPYSGIVRVETGRPDGSGRLSSGVVETSSDGRIWVRLGTVSKRTGAAVVRADRPILYLRVRPTNHRPEPLILREIVFP